MAGNYLMSSPTSPGNGKQLLAQPAGVGASPLPTGSQKKDPTPDQSGIGRDDHSHPPPPPGIRWDPPARICGAQRGCLLSTDVSTRGAPESGSHWSFGPSAELAAARHEWAGGCVSGKRDPVFRPWSVGQSLRGPHILHDTPPPLVPAAQSETRMVGTRFQSGPFPFQQNQTEWSRRPARTGEVLESQTIQVQVPPFLPVKGGKKKKREKWKGKERIQ